MNRKRYFQELAFKEKTPVGKLSPELRKALHLEDDMLPVWIYRMRILGYPPAWMKDAEMSTLNIIDGSAGPSTTDNSNTLTEEGEIKETKLPSQQYNKDSLIEFPGFNAPIPDNVKDDWLILGMPPLIMNQQLSEAVKSMKMIEPVPYKRSKLDISTGSGRSSPESIQQMDAEENDISLEQDSTADDSLEVNGEKDESGELSTVDETNSESKTSTEEVQEDNNDNSSSTGDRKVTVISTCAPLPKSIRPNLPPMANFAVGMGELIYFENLPDSTGTYSGKLKDSILKCRKRFEKESEPGETD